MAEEPGGPERFDVDLEELLDALPVLINVISPDQRYAWVNRRFERLHDTARTNIVGHKLSDMLGPAYAPIRAEIERALAGERVRFDVDLDAPGGGTQTFRTTYVPRFREDGTPNGFISHSQNITAQKQAERERQELAERLETLQRLEGLAALAGGVAHDFNNLLVSVLANAQWARRALGDGHALDDELGQIERAARRASELARQMLAYSGGGALREDRVDLALLVEQTADLLHAALAPRVELRLDLPGGLPPVAGDAAQLRQLIANLLTNASESVGDGGVIRLGLARDTCSRETLAATWVDDGLEPGEYLRLHLQDDGDGITAETRSRIFDPFFSTKRPGRGLGLAASLGIVRSHRGAIAVESEPGRGTRFDVWLPSVAPAAEARPSRPVPSAEVDGARVLVVDDDARVRRIAARILSRAGFEVASASNGREALERVGKAGERFDVILLDLTMPVLGGVETLEHLRAQGVDTPVVICSGYGEDHVRGAFRDLQVAAVVEKPFDIDALVEVMRGAVG